MIFAIVLGALLSSAEARTLSLSGSYGFYAEGYHMDGRESRRPGTTGRMYLTPVLSFYGLELGLKMDYFLTTEQKFTAQPINRISLAPTWSWGRVDIWNSSPRFSDFTLGGVTVRGAGVYLHPGRFTFSLVGGRSQRPEEGESFGRDLYGVQVGYGGFKVNFLRVKDDVNSIREFGRALPQENMVLGVSADFSVLRAKFSGEVSASVYTRDLRSEEVDLDTLGAPGFVDKLYNFRYSTRVDYAWRARVSVPVPRGSVSGSYVYVGPGYTSLGLATNHNDRVEYRISGRVRPSGMLSLSCSFGGRRDNLIGDKLGTTTNRNISLAAQVSPSSAFNVSLSYLFNRHRRKAPSDTSDAKVQVVGASTVFTFEVGGVHHSVRPAFSYQDVQDGVRRRSSGTKGFDLSYTGRITPYISTSAGFSRTESDAGAVSLTSYGGGVTYRALAGKVPISLNLSYIPSSRGSTLRARLGGSYRIPKAGSVRFGVGMTKFSGGATYPSYKEFTANLSYSGRFSTGI